MPENNFSRQIKSSSSLEQDERSKQAQANKIYAEKAEIDLFQYILVYVVILFFCIRSV